MQDPDRLADVDAVGVDETAIAAASATRSTSYVTGIVDLTADVARRGCSTLSPGTARPPCSAG